MSTATPEEIAVKHGVAGTAAPTSQAPIIFTKGGTFILDVPSDIPGVWGSGKDILWAEGEALMICGGNGVGKTTIAGQLARARLGLLPEVLGCPVAPTGRKVLYLAMDRPRQVGRALRRIFAEEDRALLDGLLEVWQGPPPYDLAKQPSILTALCEQAGADTVIIDSLKDAAIGLSEDEVGAGYNRARQHALARGIEVLELHHTVKRASNGGKPVSIEDVYGSRWLTAGAGSVVMLIGEPGDPVVGFRHLKQPTETVGPFDIIHDHDAGTSKIGDQVDLVALATTVGTGGLTARRAAEAIYGKDRVTKPEVEKARRRLDRLAAEKKLTGIDAPSPGRSAVWFPM
jgi:replicative DNA helicase